MDLHELRVAARLIDGLAKRALFAEKQMVALEGQCAEWQRIADELKAERDAAKQEAASARQDAVTRAEADRKRIDGLMIQAQDMRAEIERLKKPARQHPVAVGEWVQDGHGKARQVREVHADWYLLSTGYSWTFDYCTPCDPPTEATHDTPEGRSVAESVVKVEPKPGDVVRLVRVPTNDEYPHDSGRWEPSWGGIGDYMRVHQLGNNINGTRIVRAAFGLEWPISCIEIVEDAK